MDDTFRTTHNLDFYYAYDHLNELRQIFEEMGVRNDDDDPAEWFVFRVGTCEGQWRKAQTAYEILSVRNSEPGNGHFTDVMEWFENSCVRDRADLRIREVANEPFRQHLLTKRGFQADLLRPYDVVKPYSEMIASRPINSQIQEENNG